jgi:hypothetical protein
MLPAIFQIRIVDDAVPEAFRVALLRSATFARATLGVASRGAGSPSGRRIFIMFDLHPLLLGPQL